MLRLVLVGPTTVALGWVFGFPSWAVCGFAIAAVAAHLVPRWRPVRRAIWTALIAAFLAQATDLFVTPFTWELRFGFFAVLVGAWLLVWGTQVDPLEST